MTKTLNQPTPATQPRPCLHLVSKDCWCNPGWNQPGQFVEHTNADGTPAEFEPAIIPGADEVDADGYSREDHR